MTLSDRHPIFVGYKMDGSLRRRLEALTGPERKYIADDGDFLRILRFGEDGYVGKVFSERITTDRIDDIRRNVLSILQRLSPGHAIPHPPRHPRLRYAAPQPGRPIGCHQCSGARSARQDPAPVKSPNSS